MKVHLLKSEEVDTTLFSKVVDFLQSVPGPINFLYQEGAVTSLDEEDRFIYTIRDSEHFEGKSPSPMESFSLRNKIFPFERETISWQGLFKKADQYRRLNGIPDDEFVLLLTDIANKQNWFAALDEQMPYNGFVHTADWNYFIQCSSAFPIAYEVVALVLQKHMFNGLYDVRTRVHETPIGCVNDLCLHKREIILKLRTGDVCQECLERIDDALSVPAIHQALQILSSLREKMLFAQNLKKYSPLSRLLIDRRGKIFLPDFDNIEIKLRPLEKALYHLFLRYPEGIYLSSLCDHRQELYTIYSAVSNTDDLHEMHSRIDDMVNSLNPSASQKMSKIKKTFEEAIGPDLAKHYYIHGEQGQKKRIDLERRLVSM